jgi:hypothetical protein
MKLGLIITFNLLLVLGLNAQSKKVVLQSKKNNLKNIFKLPHYAKVKLFSDTLFDYNNVIIDSMKNDTIYVSNPLDLRQHLSIATIEIEKMKIPNHFVLELLKYTSSSFFTLGGIELLVEKLNRHNQESVILASMIYFGLTTTIIFSGPTRAFKMKEYIIFETAK